MVISPSIYKASCSFKWVCDKWPKVNSRYICSALKMGEDKFDEDKFMKALLKLKDTQESIHSFTGQSILFFYILYGLKRK